MKEEYKIIIPSGLEDDEIRDFLDANYETCPQCSEYLSDEEIHTHDCGIEPQIGNSKYMLCCGCLKQATYSKKRHEGEEHCECGGDYCACNHCLKTLELLKAGETKKQVLGTTFDVEGWTVNGINQQ